MPAVPRVGIRLPRVGCHDRRGFGHPFGGLPRGPDNTRQVRRLSVRLLLSWDGHEYVQVPIYIYMNHLKSVC